MKSTTVVKRMKMTVYNRHHDLCDGAAAPNYEKTIKKMTRTPSDYKISWTIIAIFNIQLDGLSTTTRETIRDLAVRRQLALL